MTKKYDFQYYYSMLLKYINAIPEGTIWDGTIIRKKNNQLYKWWVELRNGRRKLKPDKKMKLLQLGLFLNDMVSDFINYSFEKWLHILEDYLHTTYYYGIKNGRTDKKHIGTWNGILKRNSGNFKNNNLYEWYQKIRYGKYKITDEQKHILESIGLNLNRRLINKRLTFDNWIEIIKDFKKENGGSDWNGIISTKANNFKNRNLYEFINSLRDKQLTSEQINKLQELNVTTTLCRKKIKELKPSNLL